MSKVQPLIIVDLRLKKQIMDFVIKELVRELNIDKEFKNKNLELLKKYSCLKLELQKYTFIIPYKELDKYKKLKYQEKKVFLKIKRLLAKCWIH